MKDEKLVSQELPRDYDAKKTIIEKIAVLSEVVKVNKGWFGSESTADKANAEIKRLISQLN